MIVMLQIAWIQEKERKKERKQESKKESSRVVIGIILKYYGTTHPAQQSIFIYPSLSS